MDKAEYDADNHVADADDEEMVMIARMMILRGIM
jgi:hypothetical protein